MFTHDALTGNKLTGVAEQFVTQDQENAMQVPKCIAVFPMKNAISYQILQNSDFLLCKILKVIFLLVP